MHTGLAATRQRRVYRGLTLRAGVVAAAGPFAWGGGVSVRRRFGPVGALIGRLLGVLGSVDLSGAWGVSARRCVGPLIGRFGPAACFSRGALFGALARAGNAAPHKKALVFFINAGKFLADGGRLALFGGHITHNARAGVCLATLRE